MNTDIKTLYMRYEAAAECLSLLEQQNNNPAAIEQQRRHCQQIRAQMNALCPDGTMDVNEYNVVEQI